MNRLEHGIIALVLGTALFFCGCPKPPVPPPVTPADADAAVRVGDAAPVQQPPDVVVPADAVKCAVACRNSDQVKPGSLNACSTWCARAGGAFPERVDCMAAAKTPQDLTDCGKLRGAGGAPGGGPIQHGR